MEISKSPWWRHLYSPKLQYTNYYKQLITVVCSVRGGATVSGGSHLIFLFPLYCLNILVFLIVQLVIWLHQDFIFQHSNLAYQIRLKILHNYSSWKLAVKPVKLVRLSGFFSTLYKIFSPIWWARLEYWKMKSWWCQVTSWKMRKANMFKQ